MKKSKKIIIGVLGLAVLGLLYFIYAANIRQWYQFDDNAFSGVPCPSTGGKLALKLPKGVEAKVKAGDRMEIKQAPGAVNPEYDGKTEVVKICEDNGHKYIVTKKGFLQNTPANPGLYRRLNVFRFGNSSRS